MTLQFACQRFCAAEDVFDSDCGCDLDDTVPADVAFVELMIDMASDLLSLISVITGICEVTVRPVSLCGGADYQSQYGSPDWTNQFGGVETIPLRGPNTNVIEILIDGQVIPFAHYGLFDDSFLYRKVGGEWPTANNLLLDSTQTGTFEVTYRFGRDPDKLTKMAATELACELLLDATPGKKSNLPRGVTAANIQGAQVTIRDRAQALKEGSESIPVVNRFLFAYGLDSINQGGGVWSPELEQRWNLVQVLGGSGS